MKNQLIKKYSKELPEIFTWWLEEKRNYYHLKVETDKILKEEKKKVDNLFRKFKVRYRSLKDNLSPREQKILEMRFGLGDGVTHTLEEVGQEFCVTRDRIRQLENKGLMKLNIYV